MITLLDCGPMLTSIAFGLENILLGFDSLVLSGPDIPSACFDLRIPIERPVLADCPGLGRPLHSVSASACLAISILPMYT